MTTQQSVTHHQCHEWLKVLALALALALALTLTLALALTLALSQIPAGVFQPRLPCKWPKRIISSVLRKST